METIKTLYKIGHGPSSSHTMGPANAAKYYKHHYPIATEFKVILYGSLALTGKGHLTDLAIIQTFAPAKVTIEWNATDTSIEHPNTMDFIAYHDDKIINTTRIFSIGGGAIRIKGEDKKKMLLKQIYKDNYATQIIKTCKNNKINLYQYIQRLEDKVLWHHLDKVWNVMQQAITKGLKETGVLPGQLKLGRRASILFNTSAKKLKKQGIDLNHNLLMAYAFAVSETNASGGIVVTAPTCGACGILPAVLLYTKDRMKLTKQKIIEALAVAGLIGNIARQNGSIAGAEAGCQAEVGVACSMTAAAYAYLLNLPTNKIFDAASVALEHHLGLTCDPVLGFVQSPCIERNALAAIRAIDAVNLAALSPNHKLFSYDDIIQTMLETGKALQFGYRETSTAGLAHTWSKKHKNKIKHNVFDIKVS